MTKSLAPIVLFVYNRPLHTLQTLESLAKNTLANESVLYIYADGIKKEASKESYAKIEETREIIKQQKWCKEVHIIEADLNKGLANSIIEGVTTIVNKYGKIIVLEDDIVTSPGFLQYMNDALDTYEKEEKVMHISGWTPVTTGANKLPETYLLHFVNCWGWATWANSWKELITDSKYLYDKISINNNLTKFTLDKGFKDIFLQLEKNKNGILSTWFVKWYSSIFLKNGLSMFPKFSLINNIGFDGSGANCKDANGLYDTNLAASIKVEKVDIKEHKYARNYFRRFYLYGNDSSMRRILLQYIKNFEKSFSLKKMNIIQLLKKTYLYKLYSYVRY